MSLFKKNMSTSAASMSSTSDKRADQMQILNEEIAQEIIFQVKKLKEQDKRFPKSDRRNEYKLEEDAIKIVLKEHPHLKGVFKKDY